MAIIEAKGLFSGDRLSRCSDEAQLHWVRLYSAANGFARIELNYRKLIAAAYSGFRRPPTEAKFRAWIQEYRDNFLLFVYKSSTGTFWGQWSTDERHLPRYKTAEDKRSPAPPQKQLDEFNAEYASSKQSEEHFGNFSGNIPTSTEISPDPVNTHIGVGGGDGVGKKEGGTRAHAKESESAHEPTPPADPEAIPIAVKQIVCAHPKSRLRKLQPREVTQAQEVAVLGAMADEIGPAVTDVQALAMMLERTEMLAEGVPRREWRFFKDVVEFFRNHDYRMDPEDIAQHKEESNGRIVGNGRPANNIAPAKERVRSGADAARAAARASAEAPDWGTAGQHGGRVSTPGHDGINADVPARAGEPGGGIRDGPIAASSRIATDAPEILSPSQRNTRGA